jgi:hypothetical protein
MEVKPVEQDIPEICCPCLRRGAKLEPRLWGTQARSRAWASTWGWLSWCQAQSPNSAKNHSDNWLDCIAGSYLCTRKAQTVIHCCTYVRILRTGTCNCAHTNMYIAWLKDTQLLENPYVPLSHPRLGISPSLCRYLISPTNWDPN